ncbi:DUF1294 domain-containing protein [Novosphingobium sp. 9]|uniref:DUF1294 domain-containing protein n=1 Tax=Novosphingobium sp. 9 TaxID=2025349 RepID=UPI0021B58865|nr:DUF1294 domain-containing protein [Novosphingobium sp. 9]
MPDLFQLILVALGCVNLAAFIMFWTDKRLAQAGRSRQRISERHLLMLAFFGGTPGAYAARSLFRHKTRKQPFVRNLHAIAILQAVALAVGGGWWLGG